MSYEKIKIPESGEKISYIDGNLVVPNNPVIPYIAVSYTHLTLPTKRIV